MRSSTVEDDIVPARVIREIRALTFHFVSPSPALVHSVQNAVNGYEGAAAVRRLEEKRLIKRADAGIAYTVPGIAMVAAYGLDVSFFALCMMAKIHTFALRAGPGAPLPVPSLLAHFRDWEKPKSAAQKSLLSLINRGLVCRVNRRAVTCFPEDLSGSALPSILFHLDSWVDAVSERIIHVRREDVLNRRDWWLTWRREAGARAVP